MCLLWCHGQGFSQPLALNVVILVLLGHKQCQLEERAGAWLIEVEMRVVQAQIQTVEEIYRLIWTAVANKKPVEVRYQGRPRLFCPHRLGRNREGQLRVLCYQYGGESKSGLQPMGSAANWRCVGVGETQQGEVSGRCLAHGAEPFATCFVRGANRYRRGRSSRTRPTERTLRKLAQ